MDNKKELQENELGLDFWTNEVEYFEKALEGLSTSYSLLKRMQEHAQAKVNELQQD